MGLITESRIEVLETTRQCSLQKLSTYTVVPDRRDSRRIPNYYMIHTYMAWNWSVLRNQTYRWCGLNCGDGVYNFHELRPCLAYKISKEFSKTVSQQLTGDKAWKKGSLLLAGSLSCCRKCVTKSTFRTLPSFFTMNSFTDATVSGSLPDIFGTLLHKDRIKN